MSKTEMMKKISKLRDLAEEVLNDYIEEEVEKLEEKEDLTEKQEEKLDWLENLRDALETTYEDLEEYDYYSK